MRHRRPLIAFAAAAAVALALSPVASATDRGSASPPDHGHPGTTETTTTADGATTTTSDGGTTTTEAPEPTTSTTAPAGGTVEVQLLALNDFHGNLETGSLGINPTTGGSSGDARVDAGGAAYLAGHIAALEEGVEHSIVVSAGDLIGASPLLSALFHDEPTIEAMNLIGLDLNAVGNHEFDEGADELRRMADGGCHPTDGCLDGDDFAGADFEFLAANVVDAETGETLFAPYAVRDFDGAKVAFIGMTLEGTPSIVAPSGIAGLEFLDEADTVNALIPTLQEEEGVDAVVVLLHEGGTQTGDGPRGINDCNELQGPIVDIADRLSDEVDLVVSGHTHQAYDCVLDGKVVTSASSFGRVVTDIGLTIDTEAGEVTGITTENLVVTRDVAPDGEVEQLVAKYQAIAEPLANRVIGATQGEVLRAPNEAGESPLGDVIADAQLAATAAPDLGGAVVAFMNPGGIRADLNAGEAGEAEVTYGESFTVQPFGNNLVTVTLTGEQLDALLEAQFCNVGPADTAENRRILQVSAGFAYAWDATAPCGSKVDPATTTLGGTPIDPAAGYRVTINSFLADGGDNFAVLRDGTDRLGGGVDTDALEAYFEANSPVPPGPTDRISVVGAAPPAPAA